MARWQAVERARRLRRGQTQAEAALWRVLRNRRLLVRSGEARPWTGQGDVLGDGRRVGFMGRLRKRIDRRCAARSERGDACCRAERQSTTVTPGQVLPRPDWPHLPLGCNG